MIAVRAQQVKGGTHPAPRIGVAFAPIPLDVKARRDVSPTAKLVFATVANQARMRRGEVSNLTNRRIAERAGLSVPAVRRALDELEGLGLIRRLFGDSKRIRLGIAITYAPEGVAQPRATLAEGVAPHGQPGCSPTAKEGCASATTHLLRTGEKHLEMVSSLDHGEEDPTQRVAEGPAAAAYLRACIEAGRKGQEPPPPPCPAETAETPQDEPSSRSRLSASPRERQPGPSPALPAALVAEDDIRRMVARMTTEIGRPAVHLRVAPGSPPSGGYQGRRKTSPRELQRQLAEVRRKYGGRTPGRPDVTKP